mgnify:CR=1 FL=1
MKENGLRPHSQRKECRGRQLTEWKNNAIGYVFGTMRQRAGGVILRTGGIFRSGSETWIA